MTSLKAIAYNFVRYALINACVLGAAAGPILGEYAERGERIVVTCPACPPGVEAPETAVVHGK